MARRARSGSDSRRGSFRIIGGRWRGRRLDFLDDGSVRPSPDRVRETLFNWAMPYVRGARCLDLFAGSGALGLEALSRGAAEVVFVDRQRGVTANVERHLTSLGVQAEVVCADALDYLRGHHRPFDLVFLDPPFRQGLLTAVMQQLPALLAPGAHVYIEAEKDTDVPLPDGFELLKGKSAGQLRYHWVEYQAPDKGAEGK